MPLSFCPTPILTAFGIGMGLPARFDSGPGCGYTSTILRCCLSAFSLMRSLACLSSSVNSILPEPNAGLPHPPDELDVGGFAPPKAGRLPKPPRGLPDGCEFDCKYCTLDPSSSSRNAAAVAGGFDAGLELCRNRRCT
jgi:hypothetical protein